MHLRLRCHLRVSQDVDPVASHTEDAARQRAQPLTPHVFMYLRSLDDRWVALRRAMQDHATRRSDTQNATPAPPPAVCRYQPLRADAYGSGSSIVTQCTAPSPLPIRVSMFSNSTTRPGNRLWSTVVAAASADELIVQGDLRHRSDRPVASRQFGDRPRGIGVAMAFEDVLCLSAGRARFTAIHDDARCSVHGLFDAATRCGDASLHRGRWLAHPSV